MSSFTKWIFTLLLLCVAGVTAASAQEDEKVYATFENPTGITWDAENRTFSWDAPWGNQLHNIGLPSGNLTAYEKLVIDCTILEGESFRFMFYATNKGTTAGGVTVISESGKKEFILSELGMESDYLTTCSEICLSGNGNSGKVKVNEVYLVKSSDPLAGAKELLTTAIAKGKIVPSFAYTETSFAALSDAVTTAEAALVAAAATAESLQAATDAIENAIKALATKEGFSILTADMFKKWDSATAPTTGEGIGCSYVLYEANGLPFGDGSVGYLNFANLAEYEKLQVAYAEGTPRIMMNRDVNEGQWNENEAESHLIDNTKDGWHNKYFSTENNVITVDLKQLVADKGIANLNAIKGANFGNVNITGLFLYKESTATPVEPIVVTFDFNASEHAVSNDSNDGDITADETLSFDGITLTVTSNPVGTPNRYWNTNKGPQLRMYGGTMTIMAPEGLAITKVEINQGKWNAGNTFNGEAAETSVWEGNSTNVILAVAGNTQMNYVTVTTAAKTAETTTYATSEPVHIANTAETAYDVAKAIELIEAGEGLSDVVFVKGIISKIEKYNENYKSITYWISADGSETAQQFQCYSGKGIDGADFASIEDIVVGAEVIVTGTLKKYTPAEGDAVYELNAGNALVSYTVPVHIANTAETAYDVAKAIELIEAGEGLSDVVFVKGIISKIEKYNENYKSITYWISADGTESAQQFQCYSGKGIDGADFASIEDIVVGAEVIVTGTLKKYTPAEGDAVYELNAGNALVSYTVPVNYFIDFEAGAYYIIDVESGKFMAAGHDWGTRGIISERGLDLTITPNTETKMVTIDSRVSNGGNSHFLGSNLYMDATAAEWGLIYKDFGFYITNGTQYINYDENDNLVLSDQPREWIIVSAEGVKAQVLEEMAGATAGNPVDATFLIKANNFNRNDARNAEAWAVSADCTNKNLSGGNNTNNCAESYHSVFTISQAIQGLPKGIYALKAQGFYRQDGETAEDAPVFFANEETAAVPAKTGAENSMSDASASFTSGLYTIEPIFVEVGEDGALTIGVKATGTQQWVIFDNFTLTYYGANANIDELKNAAIFKELAELRTKATTLKEQVEVETAKRALDQALTETADASGAEAINAAITTLKAAIADAEVFVNAKTVLAQMKELVDGTNVYTEEALNEYYGQWVAKYEEGTITQAEVAALQNPFLVTGWHANITCDNFLLSAWDTNPDFQDAPYYINSWSVEGDTDGSNFRVPFYEYWTGDANSLGERVLTATMNNVEPGTYDVTAWVRVRIKNDAEAPTYGITLSANDGEAVNVAAGDQVGTSQMYLKEFTAVGTVGEDGVLKIQFNIAADNNISWLSFKNVMFTKQKPVIIAHTWNFNNWSEETVANLKADAAASKTQGWSDVEKKADAEADAEPTEASKDNCFWLTDAEGGELKANGVAIAELAGLDFNPTYAGNRSLAIAVNYPSTSLGTYAGPAYLWLGGGGKNVDCFTIKNVKAGTQITMGVESHKAGNARGVQLFIQNDSTRDMLKDAAGNEVAVPIEYTEQTWAVPGEQGVCDVIVYNTSGCHIYFIDAEIGEAPVEEWADLIVNGDMEGESMECFYVTEQGVGGPFVAVATEGIGTDGSKAVKVQSADAAANDGDTQFFIRLPYQLPAGTKYRVTFDYKADQAAAASTQAHTNPGGYIYGACIGDMNFTTEWQTYEKTGSISADMSSADKPMQTIAFNLALNKLATEFIFDNVKFEVEKSVVGTLVLNPDANPTPYPSGIKTINAAKADGQYFDLMGRRVVKPTKGLYIQDGKKMFVK